MAEILESKPGWISKGASAKQIREALKSVSSRSLSQGNAAAAGFEDPVADGGEEDDEVEMLLKDIPEEDYLKMMVSDEGEEEGGSLLFCLASSVSL